MNSKVKLNKLPQELVNQIAAGEVIERPASVVKELMDNSIDAQASKIHIRILNGGIDLIEISDNGIGIPKENIQDIFSAHTTSKISSFEDLNNLLTMGFRGEALSTIVSISKLRLVSKYTNEDIGNEISFDMSKEGKLKSAARESGTSISVENIFQNVPARRKFLKSPQTEYKKILDILFPYFLIYPNIHFVLEKDSKVVLDLKPISNSKGNTIEMERVQSILKDDFVKRMMKIFYDGSGVKIKGYVGHPSDHQSRVTHQYIFVNRRPIRDNGIARAIYQGLDRYMPHGQRVPFILIIDINPDLVDVNVHPRKEEVRFLNPFRVYSAVQEAVGKAVQGVTSYKVEGRDIEGTNNLPKRVYSSRDISFTKNSQSSVQDSLLFSKEALERDTYTPTSYIPVDENVTKEESLGEMRNIFQIFNKYIVIEFNNDILWVIDQHAAAERITFEKLKNIKGMEIDKQNFLVPHEVNMSAIQLVEMEELKKFFNEVNIQFDIEEGKILIKSAPVEFVNTDFKKFFDEIFALSDDTQSISKEISRLKEDIYATMACHGSVRSGQALHREEMVDIYQKLIQCNNPYSCPHGRPAIWKLKLSDIDLNFERTY